MTSLIRSVLICALAYSAQLSSGPQIDTVVVTDTTLTVAGKHLGAGTPIVTLGDQRLEVLRNSDSEIVAAVSSLADGIYELRITRDGATTPDDVATSTVLVR